MRLFTILMTLLIAPMAYGWPERGPDGVPTGREIDSSAVFSPGSWRGITVVRTDPAALAAVARSTAAWMRAHPDDPAVVAGLLGETGVSLQDVLVTLDLVARLADEDIANGTTRLTEPEFLAQHFSRVSWKPDAAGARARGVRVDHRIRMTRYLVYRQTGSLTPTAAHPYALYAAPPESAGDADPVRLRYTRQDVIGGVFESKGAAEGLAGRH